MRSILSSICLVILFGSSTLLFGQVNETMQEAGSSIKKIDLSKYLKINTEFKGIFNNSTDTFNLCLSSVSKDRYSRLKYIVEGYTSVKGGSKNFNGTLQIVASVPINNSSSHHTNCTNKLNESRTAPRHNSIYKYLLIIDYTLYEDRFQNGSGFYKGSLQRCVYLVDSNTLLVAGLKPELKDEIDSAEGIWHLYTDDISKKYRMKILLDPPTTEQNE